MESVDQLKEQVNIHFSDLVMDINIHLDYGSHKINEIIHNLNQEEDKINKVLDVQKLFRLSSVYEDVFSNRAFFRKYTMFINKLEPMIDHYVHAYEFLDNIFKSKLSLKFYYFDSNFLGYILLDSLSCSKHICITF